MDYRHDIENMLNEMQVQMDEQQWQQFWTLTQEIFNTDITTLEIYEMLKKLFREAHRIVSDIDDVFYLKLSKEELTQLSKEQTHYIGLITELGRKYRDLETFKNSEYVNFLLFDIENLRTHLFGGMTLTKDNINSRYRQLIIYFHPNCVYGTEFESVYTELFQNITQIKEELLNEIRDKNCEKQGNHEWKIAQDYKNAGNPNYMLRVLSQTDVDGLSNEEMEHYKKIHAKKAFQYYRSAMLGSGYYASLDDSIRLRKNMILCLLLMGKESLVEAELYSLGAIYVTGLCETPGLCETARRGTGLCESSRKGPGLCETLNKNCLTEARASARRLVRESNAKRTTGAGRHANFLIV